MATDAVLGRDADLGEAAGGDILDVLAVGATICDAARTALDHIVAAARHRQCSWADIGTALGMSRQAAFQRFGRRGTPSAQDGRQQ